MRVPVKLLIFSFWLFFLNCSRCQECLREDIKYENTELAAKASYADGETARVTCMTGYTGLYKLNCEKGEWKTSIERPCAKKKCSNPGDTPNGEFKLTEGMEFVFGATVVYTCKKGYEMTSRINQRTCRAQGWDNTLPVCEAVKCPAIHTDGDVIASGNTEEGSYSDVIHFECVSSEKKIDGSREIYCKDTGEWSDVVPKCKDITCTAPLISNGHVADRMPEYQKGAILKYRCDPGFKPREGIPRCAKFGWTLNPECDEVTCELPSTTFGVENINPAGKTIFRAEESVKITCSKNYWFSFTKETSKSFTCQYNGEWDDRRTVCQEIRCEFPHDQYVSYGYFRGDTKLGAKQSYSCKYGYRSTSEEATCTRDGWTPKPLCAEIKCVVPNISNAEILGVQKPYYKINSKIQYKCSPGFEPEKLPRITCNSQGQWTGIRQCTEILCAAPNIPNAKIVGEQRPNYRINSGIEYECNFGFEPEDPVQIICNSQRQWINIRQCTEIMCETPNIPNAEIVGGQRPNYKINSRIQYKCSLGFEPEQPVQITCDCHGQWTGKQTCNEIMCAAPYIPNAEIVGGQRPKYKINSTIEYKCSTGFEPEQPVQITCDSQRQWTDIQTCTAMCAAPYILNAEIVGGQITNYKINSTIEYKCSTGFEPEQPVQITCDSQRQWTDIQTCTAMCAAPYIPNAEIVGGQRTNYKINSTIEYKCSTGFEPEQPVQITCDSQRQWTDIQTCTVQKQTRYCMSLNETQRSDDPSDVNEDGETR